MRRFNIKGLCDPEEDYMVDMSRKVVQLKSFVYDKRYFSIGNTPKCGKTTVLAALERALRHG